MWFPMKINDILSFFLIKNKIIKWLQEKKRLMVRMFCRLLISSQLFRLDKCHKRILCQSPPPPHVIFVISYLIFHGNVADIFPNTKKIINVAYVLLMSKCQVIKHIMLVHLNVKHYYYWNLSWNSDHFLCAFIKKKKKKSHIDENHVKS